MVYSSCIVVYLKVYNFVQNKILMGFKIWSSWGVGYTNSKFTLCTTIFVFSSKTSFFAGLGAFFGTFFLRKEDFAFKITESFKNRENENGLLEEGANPVPVKSTGSSDCRTTSPPER